MPRGKRLDANQTRNDIRHMFDQWDIQQFSIIREQEEYLNGVVKRGQGATVTYLRQRSMADGHLHVITRV